MVKLNLGCGYDIKDGWVNVDRVQRPGVDVLHDLDVHPWQWEDSSVEELQGHHVVEHVADFCGFVNELWRVLAPGAVATLTMPHGRSDRAWQDPSHRRMLTEASFLYVQKTWREQNGIDYLGLVCDFDPVTYGVVYTPGWELRSDEARAFALKHYWNVALDLHVFLTAKK